MKIKHNAYNYCCKNIGVDFLRIAGLGLSKIRKGLSLKKFQRLRDSLNQLLRLLYCHSVYTLNAFIWSIINSFHKVF